METASSIIRRRLDLQNYRGSYSCNRCYSQESRLGIVIGFYSSVIVVGPLFSTLRDSAVNVKKKE